MFNVQQNEIETINHVIRLRHTGMLIHKILFGVFGEMVVTKCK